MHKNHSDRRKKFSAILPGIGILPSANSSLNSILEFVYPDQVVRIKLRLMSDKNKEEKNSNDSNANNQLNSKTQSPTSSRRNANIRSLSNICIWNIYLLPFSNKNLKGKTSHHLFLKKNGASST